MRTGREMLRDVCDPEKPKTLDMTMPKKVATTTRTKTTRLMIVKSIWAIAGFVEVIATVLQEVFDESAYRRFLVRGNLASSAASYAAFWVEQEQSRARRPRCC